MRIHCFGASVTQQSVNHISGEITGYTLQLKKQLAKTLGPVDVEVTACGSSYFDTAGYCLLPGILDSSPDVLVFEWFTTGLKRFDDVLWSSAVKMIRDSEIPTIFAIFPKRSLFSSGLECDAIWQARGAIGGNIFVLDIYKSCRDSFSPECHLRDESHTNANGALFYAEKLSSAIEAALSPLTTTSIMHGIDGEYIPVGEPSVLPQVDSVELVNLADHAKGLSFHVKPQADLTSVRLVLDNKIGPFSPVVRLSFCQQSLEVSLWDPWCHFVRQCYSALPTLNGLPPGWHKVELSISPKVPRYSACRKEGFCPPPSSDLRIDASRIFCIGGEIEI